MKIEKEKMDLTPENLILKNGCHYLRIDNYYDILQNRTCRITCIDDDSTSIDFDGEFVEELTEGSFCVDVNTIDIIIEKLIEAKKFILDIN